MLGFTAHSEVPIGEFESSPHRQAPVTGVSATGAVRQLSLGADQVFAATGVAGTGQVTSGITNATVDADANVTPTGIAGTGAAGAFGSDFSSGVGVAIGYIETTSPSVAGTGAVGSLSPTGKHTLTSLVATSGLGVGTSADANITIASVSATASLEDFTDEDAQGTASITGVGGTGAAGWRDSDPDIPNGVYRAPEVVFLNTDFRRSATVNVVPYKEYKVYISR